MSQFLHDIQRDFQGYLLDKTCSAQIIDEVHSTEHLSAELRMDVYENAYRLRLIDTLADNFFGLSHLLGDQQFELLARRYIDAIPSVHKNIRWYGDKMVAFVGSTTPWKHQPVVMDMAQVDWHMLLAFDADDAPTVDEQVLLNLPAHAWSSLQFSFHPSMQVVVVNYNVLKFRQDARQDSDNAQPPEKLDNPSAWLIWRNNLKQHYRSMEVDEAWAIQQAKSGTQFADICAGLCEWIDAEHAPARAATLLKQWVIDGLIETINYSNA